MEFKTSYLKALEKPTTTPLQNEITEANSEYVIVADPKDESGSYAWHLWNCLNTLPSTPWFDVLKQYGVQSVRYAGYAFREFKSQASAEDVYNVAKEFFAPNRLVFCLTTPDVQGFLTDGWAAYHSWDSDGNTWSIVPCGDWPGWEQYGGSPFGHPHTELIAATHEFGEYLTDPTGQGFQATPGDFSTEVGDECNWQPWGVQCGDFHYFVSKMYSEQDKMCLP